MHKFFKHAASDGRFLELEVKKLFFCALKIQKGDEANFGQNIQLLSSVLAPS